MSIVLSAILSCLCNIGEGDSVGAAPTLQADPSVSTTGHFRLTWETATPGAAVQLQEAEAPEFAAPRMVYEGPDRATVISGQPDGRYFYRVRTAGGPWSEVLTVRVEHHNLAQALLFLVLGAAVFLATAVLITCGHLAHRRQERVR